MKKILILLILLFALFFISCDNKNEKTPNADPNVSGEGQPGDKEPDPNGGEKDPDPNGESEKDPDPNSGSFFNTLRLYHQIRCTHDSLIC